MWQGIYGLPPEDGDRFKRQLVMDSELKQEIPWVADSAISCQMPLSVVAHVKPNHTMVEKHMIVHFPAFCLLMKRSICGKDMIVLESISWDSSRAIATRQPDREAAVSMEHLQREGGIVKLVFFPYITHRSDRPGLFIMRPQGHQNRKQIEGNCKLPAEDTVLPVPSV